MATVRLQDHPKGLLILFFAEMWERFSFYGMRSLLVLYMTSQLLYSDNHAYGVYGTYLALVYATPVIGGWIADKILGNQRAIVSGGVIIAFGHLALAFSGVDIKFFYAGLAFIITGTGLFKGNITALVGQLYKQNDPRRDAGFTLYYVGINLGAVLSSVACGYIGETIGWHYGFGLAGIGMLFGLSIFLKGSHWLEGHGLPPENSTFQVRKTALTVEQWLNLAFYASVPVFAFLLTQYHFFDRFLPFFGGSVAIYMLITAYKFEAEERKSLLVILALMFFHTSFWALFEQAGCSMNTFASRVVDRNLWGYELKASMFQALNPFFIIILGPVLASIWTWLGKKGREPYPPIKFVMALFQVSLGFAAMIVGIKLTGDGSKVGMIWLVLAYLLHTTGELCISPIGLSMVTKLSPARVCSTIMGIWFLSISFANYLAGLFARFSSIETVNGQVASIANAIETYETAFGNIMYFGIGMGCVLILLSPMLRPVFARVEREQNS